MARSRAAWGRARAQRWRRTWDRQQERFVLLRDWRFRVMGRWVRRVGGARARYLDLGCGPGSLSEVLLREVPSARVVAVDYDPVLLRLGRTALGDVRGHLTWVDADLREERWPALVGGRRFDAAVSSTALHWLRPTELRRLYRQLYRRIRPGGLFLNSDTIPYGRTSPRIQEAARGLRREVLERGRRGDPWTRWWRDLEREPALAAEFRLRRERYPRVHTLTPTLDLPGHIEALRAAGFREVELLWTWGESRILAAVR